MVGTLAGRCGVARGEGDARCAGIAATADDGNLLVTFAGRNMHSEIKCRFASAGLERACALVLGGSVSSAAQARLDTRIGFSETYCPCTPPACAGMCHQGSWIFLFRRRGPFSKGPPSCRGARAGSGRRNVRLVVDTLGPTSSFVSHTRTEQYKLPFCLWQKLKGSSYT